MNDITLPPLNDDLIFILGRPNFACARIANILRSAGQSIKEKSEHEQAATIHFLLSHFLRDPIKWAENAEAALHVMKGGKS